MEQLINQFNQFYHAQLTTEFNANNGIYIISDTSELFTSNATKDVLAEVIRDGYHTSFWVYQYKDITHLLKDIDTNLAELDLTAGCDDTFFDANPDTVQFTMQGIITLGNYIKGNNKHARLLNHILEGFKSDLIFKLEAFFSWDGEFKEDVEPEYQFTLDCLKDNIQEYSESILQYHCSGNAILSNEQY